MFQVKEVIMENNSVSVGGNIGGSITTGNVGGNVSSNVSGNVSNIINELLPSSEPDKPGIKELLIQMEAAIENETNLTKEDQEEALEEVKTLAEAGKNSNDPENQKLARRAIKMLRGTISGIPAASKLVEGCDKLLPPIAKIFGL